jgi:hypothetical protein
MLKELKEKLNIWEIYHVNGYEDSTLSRHQFFLTCSANSTHSQSNSQQGIFDKLILRFIRKGKRLSTANRIQRKKKNI